MKPNIRWIAIAAFVIWEAWWAYELIAAPRPDYEYRTVVALFMGIGLPIIIALVLGLFPAFWKWLDRDK